jgi:hypothetical protein
MVGGVEGTEGSEDAVWNGDGGRGHAGAMSMEPRSWSLKTRRSWHQEAGAVTPAARRLKSGRMAEKGERSGACEPTGDTVTSPIRAACFLKTLISLPSQRPQNWSPLLPLACPSQRNEREYSMGLTHSTRLCIYRVPVVAPHSRSFTQ